MSLFGSQTSETPDYDPRFDRAQTIEGAKARYADPDLDYDIQDLEADVERILEQGERPDQTCNGGHLGVCERCPPPEEKPVLGGQIVY